MKCSHVLLLLVLALSLGSCGKSSDTAKPYDIQGVKVDLPKFREAFANSAPELQGTVNELGSAIRYGQYDKALDLAGKLAASPNLTDAQKKALADLTEQVKQLATKAPAVPK